MRRIILSSILSLSFWQTASACPNVAGLPDFNCDGSAVIVVAGDSLVAGIGDKQNGNKGGYVLRAQQSFVGAEFLNFGKPGGQTRDLIQDIQHAFDGRGSAVFKDALLRADLVVVDTGRNDRWLFEPPASTLRNLKRISKAIKSNVSTAGGISPLVVTAVLMYPNRGSQAPWVKELDALIAKSSSPSSPADLRFDTVSKKLLSGDRIHPTSKGYAAMAVVFTKYLKTVFPKHVSKQRRDEDNDGLYDAMETIRFGTSPTNPDTDGDGIRDGDDSSPIG
jgi:lysophospholipase L1-like esterase